MPIKKGKKSLKFAAVFMIVLILFIPIEFANAIKITNVSVGAEGTSALLNWTTEDLANSKVEYGISSNYGQIYADLGTYLNKHSVLISSLDSETKYFYKITSANKTSQSSESIGDFTTKDITPPMQIENFTSTSTSNTVTLNWVARNETDFSKYKLYRNDINFDNVTNIATASYTDTKLKAGTDYIYSVSAVDTSGNEGVKSTVSVRTLAPDVTAPKVSRVIIVELTESTATISWETDENSNSSVMYGTAQPDLAVAINDAVSNHSVKLTGLKNGTNYFYKAVSCDKSGNCGASETYKFVAGADRIPPFINFNLPKYWNDNTIDIGGTTEQSTLVLLFINNAHRRSKQTDATGIFNFTSVALESNSLNVVRIVATDAGKNTNETTFNITTDLIPPLLTATIPELTSKSPVLVNGSVDEYSIISFYAITSQDTEAPPKVKGLQKKNIDRNSIEITWEKVNVTDLSKYVVYRSDIGAMSTTTATNYLDNAVSSNHSYTYIVAAIDTSCNIGDKSDELEISTLGNGTVYNKTIQTVDVSALQSCITPQKIINLTGKFNESISLHQGNNLIRVEAVDRAGNIARIGNSTYYSNQQPTILENNIAELSPSYSPDVTIQGRVNENATIFIYVNAQLQSTGKTEPDGRFSGKVELQRSTQQTTTLETSPTGVAGTQQLTTGNKWQNSIKITAVNIVGLNSSVTGNILYEICGEGADWNIYVDPRTVYPTDIVPRYLIDGVAQLGFGMNFTWQGPGNEPQIRSVRVYSRQLSTAEAKDWDAGIARFVSPRRSSNLKNWYQLISLAPIPVKGNTSLEMEEKISKNHVGKCKVPGAGCVRLPLIIEMNYQREDIYAPVIAGAQPVVGTSQGQQVVLTKRDFKQTQCFDFEVAIQPRIPPSALTLGLLQAMLGIVNGALGLIDGLLKLLEPATKFLFVGCGLSWVTLYVKKATEFFSCNQITGQVNFNACSCPGGICTDAAADGKTIAGTKDKCQTCYDTKLSSIQWENTMRYLCDRVMCPSVPTFKKYVQDANSKDAKKAFDKKQVTSYCTFSDESKMQAVLNRPGDWVRIAQANKEKCEKAAVLPQGYDPNLQCCEAEYLRTWQPAALNIKVLDKSACLAQGKDAKECGGWGRIYEGAADFKICKPPEYGKEQFYNFNGDYFIVGSYKAKVVQKDKQGNNVDAEADVAAAWEAEFFEKGVIVDDKQKIVAERPPADATAVSPGALKPDKLYETNEKGQVVPLASYAVKKNDEPILYNDLQSSKCIECYNLPEQERVKSDVCRECKCYMCGEYQKNEKEPRNRISACGYDSRFNPSPGKDTVIPTSIIINVCAGGGKEDFIVDPTSSILRSIQTGCLTALTAYLKIYKKMLEVIKGCFETIVRTGDGSAGVCRATLSVYVCDLMYYALRCVTQSPQGAGYRSDTSLGFIGALTNAGREVSNSVAGRYGSTNMFRVMFVERKLFNAACGAMFGGDVDIDFEGMIQQSVKIPIASTVAVTPAERRFVGFDPINGIANHNYHIGLLVVAGSDVSYTAELVCSNDASCDPAEGFEQGICDCARTRQASGQGGEQALAVTGQFGTGSLRAGDTLNVEKFIQAYSSFDARVRYDKVQVKYTYLDNTNRLKTQEIVRKIKQVGGAPPSFCYFDIGNGFYSCQLFAEARGTAYFKSGPIIADKIYNKGDKLDLLGTVVTSSPKDNPNQCKFITGQLITDAGVPYPINFDRFTTDGEYPINYPANIGFVLEERYFTGAISKQQCSAVQVGFPIDSYDCASNVVVSVDNDGINYYSLEILTTSGGVVYKKKDKLGKCNPLLGRDLNCGSAKIILKSDELPKSGEVILIYNPTPSTAVTQCDATERTFRLKLALHYGTEDCSKPSEIVLHDGVLQEKEITFKAVCNIGTLGIKTLSTSLVSGYSSVVKQNGLTKFSVSGLEKDEKLSSEIITSDVIESINIAVNTVEIRVKADAKPGAEAQVEVKVVDKTGKKIKSGIIKITVEGTPVQTTVPGEGEKCGPVKTTGAFGICRKNCESSNVIEKEKMGVNPLLCKENLACCIV